MNTAQKLLASLGVDPATLFMKAAKKQLSNTKKGPGRKHLDGKQDKQSSPS